MSNDPIDILMQEHQEVLQLTEEIDRLQKQLGGSSNVKEQLMKVIDKLNRDFDIHSLGKEEKALFPAMETFIPRDQGPIGVMIQEHMELLQKIADFKIALDKDEHDKVLEAGSFIVSVLPDHIYKEDNILYNMARMHLTTEDMDNIFKKMMQIENERQQPS